MRKIAVCSWSLHPGSARELAERARRAGVRHVQLALDPLRTGAWPEVESLAALAAGGIEVISGMMGSAGEDYSTLATIRATGGVRPDRHWAANRAAAAANARLAARLHLPLVSFHAGFLPEARSDPERATLLGRLRELVDLFAAEDVALAFETGQETAETLAGFLAELDRPAAGVNFDPANMILYDQGDPVAALARLAPWVRQVHVKDAVRTTVPGAWGREVPAGEGEVDWPAFFDVLAARRLAVDLVIEREAGDRRIEDIRRARELAERELARIGG
ncbi:MAG: sugar phosphate isomerase/epimerase family protein [Planctomycetota bacterium]